MMQMRGYVTASEYDVDAILHAAFEEASYSARQG